MIVAGIDEAGRGPVIGPMVMAICSIDEDKLPKLSLMGVDDSKQLTERKREELYDELIKICEYKIIIISPKEIDEAVLTKGNNLNKLEAVKQAFLINLILADKYIIDCPSNNIEAYQKYTMNYIENIKAKFLFEHHADATHKIVGAASILAKVTRDREIAKLRDKIKIDFGSGYPSDPKTIAFIRKYWNKYDFFRKSWETYTKIAESKAQKKLFE